MKGLITASSEHSGQERESLALARCRGSGHCCCRLMQQEGGWCGPGPCPSVDGTHHRACSFSALDAQLESRWQLVGTAAQVEHDSILQGGTGAGAGHRGCQETHVRGSCYAVSQTTLRLGGSWPMERLGLRTGLSRTLATLPKELALCRGAASRPDGVVLWFFHKKRHARPADGQGQPAGHFLRGIW